MTVQMGFDAIVIDPGSFIAEMDSSAQPIQVDESL